ncbi:MAG: hypothetical protein NW205_05135 [Hyphomicrobiaceae bacterium]|nr:hypothetical protein [Hyphomicrobiaceae bacterium]
MASLPAITAATILAALAATSTAYAGDAASLKMKPKHGVSIQIGGKHAAGYFLAKAGACDLTVLMSAPTEDMSTAVAATRLNVAVAPARPARIDTGEGKVLEFSCGPAAGEMTLRVLDQVAAATRG